MARSNLEIVFDHLHDRAAGDIESLTASFDPDVVHQGVSEELVCTGREAVLERIRIADARGGNHGLDRVELIAAGDRVVVGFAGPRFLQVPQLKGGQLFIVFTLGDGRIVRMDDHRTRAEALAAAGSPPAVWM
jgi:hypothetical protein